MNEIYFEDDWVETEETEEDQDEETNKEETENANQYVDINLANCIYCVVCRSFDIWRLK